MAKIAPVDVCTVVSSKPGFSCAAIDTKLIVSTRIYEYSSNCLDIETDTHAIVKRTMQLASTRLVSEIDSGRPNCIVKVNGWVT